MPRMTPEEREQRLLDAASELFVRLGYVKTTVSDITTRAGVSKGAFYLTFSSKDALVEALLIREIVRFSDAWWADAELHPRGGTVGGMYEAMLRALDASPVMAMVMRGDSSLLGDYLKRPGNLFVAYAQGQPTRAQVLRRLQDVGAMRDDVDADVVASLMDMVAQGLVTPAPNRPPTDALIRGIATLMDRAVTPPNPDVEAGKRVIREIVEGARRRFAELERAQRRATTDEENST